MMEIIVSERQTGKTMQLIKKSAESRGYIVVANSQRAVMVFEMARSMNLKIPFPLTFDEFLGQVYFGRGI